jgi:hypothetical protein
MLHYVPSWPCCLVHVHPCNSHGAAFVNVPRPFIQNRDSRLLWFIMMMHICNASLWENTVAGVVNEWDWNGWLLSYIAQLSLSFRFRGRNGHVFSFPKFGGRLGREKKILEVLGMMMIQDT